MGILIPTKGIDALLEGNQGQEPVRRNVPHFDPPNGTSILGVAVIDDGKEGPNEWGRNPVEDFFQIGAELEFSTLFPHGAGRQELVNLFLGVKFTGSQMSANSVGWFFHVLKVEDHFRQERTVFHGAIESLTFGEFLRRQLSWIALFKDGYAGTGKFFCETGPFTKETTSSSSLCETATAAGWFTVGINGVVAAHARRRSVVVVVIDRSLFFFLNGEFQWFGRCHGQKCFWFEE